MRLGVLLSNGKHCHTKTTSHEGAPGIGKCVGSCNCWYMTSDLGKYVRSHLDLDSYHLKVQEVLGTWDFTFDINFKDTFIF